MLPQVLPSSEFWEDIYEDLLEGEEADSQRGVRILKWYKRPREAVSQSDNILSIEVRDFSSAWIATFQHLETIDRTPVSHGMQAAGVVLEMKASVAGYLGRHLAEEGAFLPRGRHAAFITQMPVGEPAVSESFFSQEVTKSEGSVSDLQRSLDRVQASRTETVDALVSACRLSALAGLADGSCSAFVARVPGQEKSFYSCRPGVSYMELSRQLILEGDLPSDDSSFAPDPDTQPAAAHIVAAHVLRRIPAANCVVFAQPPHAAALTLRALALSPPANPSSGVSHLVATMLGQRRGVVAADATLPGAGGWVERVTSLSAETVAAGARLPLDPPDRVCGEGVLMLPVGLVIAAPSVCDAFCLLRDVEKVSR